MEAILMSGRRRKIDKNKETNKKNQIYIKFHFKVY